MVIFKEEERSGFTGTKDVDSEILLKMDDTSFLRMCGINRYFIEMCGKDNGLIFKRRLQLFYPDTIQYKLGSWKMYYAAVIKAINLLRKKISISIYSRGSLHAITDFTETYKSSRYITRLRSEKTVFFSSAYVYQISLPHGSIQILLFFIVKTQIY